MTVVQRTLSDLRLNPHLHVVFLAGTYHEQGSELAWRQLGRLSTPDVGEVLARTLRRIDKYVSQARPAFGQPRVRRAIDALLGRVETWTSLNLVMTENSDLTMSSLETTHKKRTG